MSVSIPRLIETIPDKVYVEKGMPQLCVDGSMDTCLRYKKRDTVSDLGLLWSVDSWRWVVQERLCHHTYYMVHSDLPFDPLSACLNSLACFARASRQRVKEAGPSNRHVHGLDGMQYCHIIEHTPSQYFL